MKKLLAVIAVFASLAAGAQTRGLKVAYFDMEYILEKVPDYAEAKNQLEIKAQKWKQEIEAKKNEVTKLKSGLQSEKALLTKELIEEREEEIKFLETELIEFQDKKFGPKGELISQKAVLVKPIQDQVFNTVQDIAEERKLDFVFDKSSDLTMVFAAQRHDLSEHIIRRLTRSAKREQLSSKEVKKLEAQEAEEDKMSDPDYADRQKVIEDKKAARQKMLDDRKAAADARRKEYEDRKEQQRLEREAKRAEAVNSRKSGNASQTATDKQTAAPGTDKQTTAPGTGDMNSDDDTPNTNKPAGTNSSTGKQPADNDAQQPTRTSQEERAKIIEDRKKAAEERRKKILEDREAAKKARAEQNKPKGEAPEGDTKTE